MITEGQARLAAHRFALGITEAVGLLYAIVDHFRGAVCLNGNEFSYREWGDAACGRREECGQRDTGFRRLAYRLRLSRRGDL